MNHNPNECDIVQDLLPLYYDHACSPATVSYTHLTLPTIA